MGDMAAHQGDTSPLRPSDIAGMRFTVGRRGYDPDEVTAFLAMVAERLSRLQAEVEWHRGRTEHLERRMASVQEGAYARVARDFAEAIRLADEATTRVRTDAEAEARNAISSAQTEAERILASVRTEAREILSDAKTRSERILQDATLAAVQAAEAAIVDVGASEARPSISPSHPTMWGRPPTAAPSTNGHLSAAEPIPVIPPTMETAPPAPPAVGQPYAEDDLDVHFEGSLFDLFDEPEDDL
jgi:cell division initiation protein